MRWQFIFVEAKVHVYERGVNVCLSVPINWQCSLESKLPPWMQISNTSRDIRQDGGISWWRGEWVQTSEGKKGVRVSWESMTIESTGQKLPCRDWTQAPSFLSVMIHPEMKACGCLGANSGNYTVCDHLTGRWKDTDYKKEIKCAHKAEETLYVKQTVF